MFTWDLSYTLQEGGPPGTGSNNPVINFELSVVPALERLKLNKQIYCLMDRWTYGHPWLSTSGLELNSRIGPPGQRCLEEQEFFLDCQLVDYPYTSKNNLWIDSTVSRFSQI